jgi:hypothetical protein
MFEGKCLRGFSVESFVDEDVFENISLDAALSAAREAAKFWKDELEAVSGCLDEESRLLLRVETVAESRELSSSSSSLICGSGGFANICCCISAYHRILSAPSSLIASFLLILGISPADDQSLLRGCRNHLTQAKRLEMPRKGEKVTDNHKNTGDSKFSTSTLYRKGIQSSEARNAQEQKRVRIVEEESPHSDGKNELPW